MKFLLTSAGLTNQSIVNALVDLVRKRLEECSLAYVPTASNVEEGDKTWVIDNLNLGISGISRFNLDKRAPRWHILVAA